VRDSGHAEDLGQDMLVTEIERSLDSGVPHNPGFLLMAAAKHQAIDRSCHDMRLARMQELQTAPLPGSVAQHRWGYADRKQCGAIEP
jgi:predicted RNA polymerase sigma factor